LDIFANDDIWCYFFHVLFTTESQSTLRV
jgi:hypothetical protein